MTLAQNDKNFIFGFTADRGLTSKHESIPDMPTVADFRRLRTVIAEGWPRLAPQDREVLYSVSQRMLHQRVPPVEFLQELPRAIRATRKLLQIHGIHGIGQVARELDMESKALYQDIISLWENDRTELTQRVERAVAESKADRGTRVHSRSDLKAVLDDLF